MDFQDGLDLGDDEPAVDESGALADRLGLSLEQFAELYGAPWRALATDDEGAPAGWAGPGEPWRVAGTPYQVAMRVTLDGVELGVPVGQWYGAGELTWQVHECRSVPVLDAREESVRAVLADVVKRRRSRFRYCRYCRRLTPPEERLATDVCHGCGSRWQGVIY